MNDMAATLAKPGQLLQTEPERMLRHCLPEFVRAASELLPPETFDALVFEARQRRHHQRRQQRLDAAPPQPAPKQLASRESILALKARFAGQSVSA